MIDLRRAREIAWHFAERAHDTLYNQAGVNFISVETEFELANTIRDLADQVEFWKNDSMESGKLYQDLGQVMGDACDEKDEEIKKLTEQRDTFAQDNINLRGGFYGPRAEIESHMQSEIERLRREVQHYIGCYESDCANEPPEFKDE